MKKLLLLLFTVHFSLFTFHCSAQDSRKIDSLQSLLKAAKQDTNKVKVLKNLFKIFIDKDPDKAMEYAKQSLALSEKIGYQFGIAESYYQMGNVYSDKGDFPSGLEFYGKALFTLEKAGIKKGAASLYNSIGLVYSRQGNYPEALRNYNAALKIHEETGYKKGVAIIQTNIGLVFSNQGRYPEAMENYIAALKIYEEAGDKRNIAASFTNIGGIYSVQGNFPEALKNYFAALKIAEEIGHKRGISILYNNIGRTYKDLGKYPEAKSSILTSLAITKEMGDKQGTASAYNSLGSICESEGNLLEAIGYHSEALKIQEEIHDKNIGYTRIKMGGIYLKQKKYPESLRYLNEGLAYSKKIGQLKDMLDGYRLLASLDSAKGNCPGSMEHYKLFIEIKDSLFSAEKTKKMQQFEFDKKEALALAEQEKKNALAQKELQKQKLVRNGFIGGSGIFLLLAAAIFAGFMRAAAARKKSDELLLNILPAEVATELKQTGRCQARTFSMVTVMFMDFKDFTKVSESVSAELLVDEINTCFSAFDGIIQKYRVEKIKTIGDAYICAGGLPVLNQTHAKDVINAAFEIRDFMIARKKEKDAKEEFAFEMRIGVHTGPVVAGIVGLKKFQYDIWGDTVNLAARMEQNSEAGKINISGSTYKLVKDKFNCIYRGKIEAKNKGEVEMYFVEV